LREWAHLAFGEWREGAPLAAPSTVRVIAVQRDRAKDEPE
jgi:hypothetical protein